MINDVSKQDAVPTAAKLRALLDLTRWREHVPFVLPLTLIGSLLAVYHNDLPVDWRLLAVVIGNILAVSAAFIINDVVDAPDDANDPQKRDHNVISQGIIRQRTGWLAFAVLVICALVLFLFSGWWATLWGTLGITLAYLYSARPFRLKARPLLDVASHILGAGSLPLLVGYFLYDNDPGIAWYVILTMTFTSAYGQFYNQIDDYELDVEAGLKNTTILIGKTPAMIIMYACIIMALICLLLAMFGGAFPPWLGTILMIGVMTCCLFIWKTDMRGNPAGIDAIQVPSLLILNLTAFFWLAWALGWLFSGTV